MDIFFSILVLLIVFTALCNTVYAHIYKIVNMPSTPQTRKVIINDIRDMYGDATGLTIYDLGSGYGGLCRALARYFPQATIRAIEISPMPYAISKIIQFLSLKTNYRISRGDIFKSDISDADILVCYLSHYHMNKLPDYLKNNKDKNLVLYSQGFEIASLGADKIMNVPYSLEQKLFRYKI